MAFEAGASVHAIPPAEYLVAPLGVLTPGEPAAALHVGANHGLDVLQVCVCVRERGREREREGVREREKEGKRVRE